MYLDRLYDDHTGRVPGILTSGLVLALLSPSLVVDSRYGRLLDNMHYIKRERTTTKLIEFEFKTKTSFLHNLLLCGFETWRIKSMLIKEGLAVNKSTGEMFLGREMDV